jgi:uncharacterized membrane protein
VISPRDFTHGAIAGRLGIVGKVLGIVIAGVFIGAAVMEISGYLARLRTGEKHGRKIPPAVVDPGDEATEKQDKNAPRTES